MYSAMAHYVKVRNGDGVQILVNEAYVGQELIVTYPKTADIREFVMGTDDFGAVKTSMTVPYAFDGGVEELHVYDNVLVTGFPFGLSNADQDVTFTITIIKKNNKFLRIQRYV